MPMYWMYEPEDFPLTEGKETEGVERALRLLLKLAHASLKAAYQTTARSTSRVPCPLRMRNLPKRREESSRSRCGMLLIVACTFLLTSSQPATQT